MGAGFLILMNAAASAKRQREEEEANHTKMIADGYKKELVVTNKFGLYSHLYRDTQKRLEGLAVICISCLLLSVLINLLLLLGIYSLLIPSFGALVMFLVGLSKFYNARTINSPDREPYKSPEGCVFLKTIKNEANYDYQWVKKS